MNTHKKLSSTAIYFCLLLIFAAPSCLAEEEESQTTNNKPQESQSYTDYKDSNLDDLNIRTPEASMVTEGEQNILRKILWYLPNRVIDLVDIVKADVGLGASVGAVVRVSRYGQVGGRYINPVSLRLGPHGRHMPFFFERESEYGFFSDFHQSESRHVTPLELGIGLDLGIGVYLGFSFDELADFLLGFFLLDLKHDDLVPMLEP